MSPATRLATAGFALIAVCYGLARFAFGLFLPEIRADLGLSESQAGLIGGGAFLGYCIAIVGSAAATERFGPRLVAVAAGAIAASGTLAIAVAPTAILIGIAVLYAGLSTGLASPPLAAAVAAEVRRERQGPVNTVINAGTSAGVVVSGPAALWMAGAWRDAYLGFACLALVATCLCAVFLPKRGDSPPGRFEWRTLSAPSLRPLLLAAFLMGFSSTAIWTFGGQVAQTLAGWDMTGTSLLWAVLGLAGVAGAGAGWLVARLGTDGAHGLALYGLAAATAVFALAPLGAVLPLAGAALFGAAYVTLTGVYLVWGVEALPERPATGLALAFLMIAAGQMAGAPALGAVLEASTPQTMLVCAACVALAALGLRRDTAGRAMAAAPAAGRRPCRDC